MAALAYSPMATRMTFLRNHKVILQLVVSIFQYRRHAHEQNQATLARPFSRHAQRTSISAEKKILSALPKMAKAAQSEELRAAFEKHQEETEGLD